MTRARGGLGRGLAALIPTGPATSTVSDVLLSGEPGSDRSGSSQSGSGKPGSGAAPPVIHVVPDFNHRQAESAAATTGSGSHGQDYPAGERPERGEPGRSGGPRIERENAGPRYQDLAVADIVPNPRNPRGVFDEESLAELAHSMREFGLLQPVVVRPADGRYELVMGERRWRAAQQAGLSHIPAIIRRTEDAAMLRDALLENIHRANLNPLEEAAAYQQLLDEFEVTHDELARRLGRSRPVVSNTIRLLRLPVVVQRRVAVGVLSAGHARALLGLDNPGDQEELAARVVAEGLSVRGTEEAVVLLAGTAARPRRPRRTAGHPTDPAVLDHWAETLASTFDTRVRVEMGRQKGRVTIDFATLDDLERIVAIVSPAAVGAASTD